MDFIDYVVHRLASDIGSKLVRAFGIHNQGAGPPDRAAAKSSRSDPMTFRRREFLVSAGLTLPGLLLPRAAWSAPAYPTKNIQFVVPFAAGGGFDTYVRVVGPVMEKRLPGGVNIVPFNVPAGGGSRGATRLYRARPDGYTIGILNIPGLFILQEQQGSTGYQPSEFTWIGAIGEGERYALCVSSRSPLNTYEELKALSAARPVKFSVTGPQSTSYAATMIGSRLLGLRARMITGYRGSAEYIVAAIRGDSDAVITRSPRRCATSGAGESACWPRLNGNRASPVSRTPSHLASRSSITSPSSAWLPLLRDCLARSSRFFRLH